MEGVADGHAHRRPARQFLAQPLEYQHVVVDGHADGEGEAGDHGAQSGDLYVFLTVEEHDFFVRSNDDVLCRIPISFTQAALGATIEVSTLEEKEKLKIPKGIQSNSTLRLKGKGIPHLRGYGRGDQIIEIFVQTPANLNKKQEELLKEFEKASQTVKSM